MGKQSDDRKLEELEALRTAPEETACVQLRRALKDRSAFVVAKAAKVALARGLRDVVPELEAAFDRLLKDGAKVDPQCWGKEALAKALRDLGHTDAPVFLRGSRHVQMEPVWGGQVDTAATLRATCALALVACTLDSFSILSRLTDLLADSEAQVRIDAARAIAQLSAREGALPLRLKAAVGDAEPEVVGHCLTALLSLDEEEYLPVVAGFLKSANADVRLEAAAALAASHEEEAIGHLKKFFEAQAVPEVRRAVLGLLGGSPLASSAEFLLAVMEDGPQTSAVEALAALAQSRYREQFHARAAAIVRDRPGLAAAFREFFPG